VLVLPLGCFNAQREAAVVNATSKEVNTLSHLTSMVIPNLCNAFIVPLVMLVATAFVEWPLALIMAVTIIPLVLIWRLMSAATSRANEMENSASAAAPAAMGEGVLTTYTLPEYDTVRITGITEKPTSARPNLEEAAIVVAAGRGIGGNLAPIEDLADALGAAIGSTRAVTDAGWLDHSTQIGQTGKSVSPELYVSVGISGALQQKVGMDTSKTIVAINKDADAPIFEIADFGVVGDLFTVIPQAVEEIKRRRNA